MNPISEARMVSRFLTHAFENTKAKEPCRACPHYMVRCSSGCFAYCFVDHEPAKPAVAVAEKQA